MKSLPSIWHLLHNVKKTVKIFSIFVAFLENINFKLTPSHSIVLKNGCVMISMNPDSLLHPRRSAGFLLRNPLRMEAALTLNDLGMRMVFSKITWNKVNLLWEGHKIWIKTPPTLFWCYWVQKCHNQVFLRRP